MKTRWAGLATLAFAYGALFAQSSSEAARVLRDRVSRDFARTVETEYHAADSPQLQALLSRVMARLFVGNRFQAVVLRGASKPDGAAFAVADRLFVPEQLLASVKDDDELAGAVAHALAYADLPVSVADNNVMPLLPAQCPASTGGFSLIPLGMREVCTQHERQADAAAYELLGRAGVSAAGLVRVLTRQHAQPDRINALQAKIAENGDPFALSTPKKDDCEIVQAYLDEVHGKFAPPTLRR